LSQREQREEAFMKRIVACALVGPVSGGTLVFVGCTREGPAERGGKDIDRAVEDAKDAINPLVPLRRLGRRSTASSRT
jgi:hypothetical protein